MIFLVEFVLRDNSTMSEMSQAMATVCFVVLASQSEYVERFDFSSSSSQVDRNKKKNGGTMS